jgi:hypothetical protein
MPGRQEFSLGLQPVFQVSAEGLARSLPKLVSPLSDLFAADFLLVLILLSSSFCAFHESFLARIRPPGYPVDC